MELLLWDGAGNHNGSGLSFVLCIAHITFHYRSPTFFRIEDMSVSDSSASEWTGGQVSSIMYMYVNNYHDLGAVLNIWHKWCLYIGASR